MTLAVDYPVLQLGSSRTLSSLTSPVFPPKLLHLSPLTELGLGEDRLMDGGNGRKGKQIGKKGEKRREKNAKKEKKKVLIHGCTVP